MNAVDKDDFHETGTVFWKITNSRDGFCWSQVQNLARKGESDFPAVAKIPTDNGINNSFP